MTAPEYRTQVKRWFVETAVTVGVKALVWATDGRKLHMDQTMAFSKSYDWDGWDCFRQEGYGLGSSYIIWPDSIGSARWNLYGTVDGLFITDLNGESAAKAAAQADYTARILAALTPTAVDASQAADPVINASLAKVPLDRLEDMLAWEDRAGPRRDALIAEIAARKTPDPAAIREAALREAAAEIRKRRSLLLAQNVVTPYPHELVIYDICDDAILALAKGVAE